MRFTNKLDGLRAILKFDNRWELLFRRLFSGNTRVVYKYRGMDILVDHAAGDANGVRDVLTTDMYRKFLPEMELDAEISVLDLGANTGGFPLLLHSEGHRFSRLVCVEMNPSTIQRLQRNLAGNLNNEFEILHGAVSGTESAAVAAFSSGSGTSDSIYANAEHDVEYEVPGLTLDGIFRSSFPHDILDICKMDVEGAEFEVFAGSDYSQLKRCRYLLIEIHHGPGRDRGLVMDRLRDLGFVERLGKGKDDEFHHVHLFVNN